MKRQRKEYYLEFLWSVHYCKINQRTSLEDDDIWAKINVSVNGKMNAILHNDVRPKQKNLKSELNIMVE